MAQNFPGTDTTLAPDADTSAETDAVIGLDSLSESLEEAIGVIVEDVEENQGKDVEVFTADENKSSEVDGEATTEESNED